MVERSAAALCVGSSIPARNKYLYGLQIVVYVSLCFYKRTHETGAIRSAGLRIKKNMINNCRALVPQNYLAWILMKLYNDNYRAKCY